MNNAPIFVNFDISVSSTGEAVQTQPIAELRRLLQQIERRLVEFEPLIERETVQDLSFNEPVLDQSGKQIGTMTIEIGHDPD